MNETEYELYNRYVDQYIEIIKQNPSKEILQSIMSVIGEYDTSKIVKGKVTNGKGSDVSVYESTVVKTKSGQIQLNEGARIETKSTYSELSSKKIRVQSIIDKEGHCEYVMICDYRSEYNRKFFIPADVFFKHALFNDIQYTKSFTWNSDYQPKGKFAKNTELLLKYEIV